MKTRNLLVLVVGFIIVAIILAPSSKPTVVSPKADITPTPTLVPFKGTRIEGSAFEDPFMESCLTDFTTEAYCACAYRYLQNNHTMEDVMRVYEEGTVAMEKFMIPAAIECINFLEVSSDI